MGDAPKTEPAVDEAPADPQSAAEAPSEGLVELGAEAEVIVKPGVDEALEGVKVTEDPTPDIATKVNPTQERRSTTEGIAGTLRFDAPELAINPKILEVISGLGWEKASIIQQETLPVILGGSSVLAQAKNGSGKTGAFGIGLIMRAMRASSKPFSCLCMANAHEVAGTIFRVVSALNEKTMVPLALCCGPREEVAHCESIKQAAIIIGTPGKIAGLITKRVLKAANLEMLVLDEADSMVGKDGHLDTVRKIVRDVEKASGESRSVQKVLFSATYNDEVWRYATTDFARGAKEVRIQTKRCDIVLKSIKQLYVQCNGDTEKNEFVRLIFKLAALAQCIIFTNSKGTADTLGRMLNGEGHKVRVTHSGLEALERAEVLRSFEKAEFNVLISTNVIARGVDIPNINMVINYDLPVGRMNQPQYEDYIHRVGRASRFGRFGMSFNLIASRDELALQKALEDYWGRDGAAFEVELLPISVEQLTKGDDETAENMAALMEKYMQEGNEKHKGSGGALV